ncbi:amidohydrolase family protein [Sagittula sp. NFXS13]|uniref:amidohydrolase family protein n=1 Tax=Sagittula sp. NFXS13 TaxID=2819095 RepID=UPI0032E02CF0
MPAYLPDLCLTGAQVLRDGVMTCDTIGVSAGRLAEGRFTQVDLRGHLILPGMVDLHGCRLEAPLARGLPAETAILRADTAAAAAGVTTGCVTLRWGWTGETDSADICRAALRALDGLAPLLRCDLRGQLVVETHSVDQQSALLALLDERPVASLLFRDGLEAAQRNRAAMPEPVRTAMDRALAQRGEVPRHLCVLADALDRKGIPYGSLGDADGETRDYYTQIGAKLCALPARRAAAALARAVGDPILLSAPEVLGKGARPCPMAARDMLAGGLGDALVSDGRYPALIEAALTLAEEGRLGLPAAWWLVSSRPAEILGLRDRGRIANGLRADLVILNSDRKTVEATICDGRLVHASPAIAARFCDVAPDLPLAAE